MTLIVNGRAIRNYNLTRSILEAYHTLLPKDKYPIVVLNLKLDPILVDVNVHPAKLEVRFSQEERLKTFIYTEIKKVLKTIDYIPQTELSIERTKEVIKPVQETLSFQVSNQLTKPIISSSFEKESTLLKSTTPLVEEIRESQEVIKVNENNLNDHDREVTFKQEEKDELKLVAPTQKKETTLELYYIGQLHGTYLLAQNQEGLFIVDQHAAMERVQYEKNYRLLADVNSDNFELLIPLVLKYSTNELLLLKEALPSLMEFGFEIEEFGGQSVVVRSVPIWAQKLDAKLIVETILNQIILDNKVDIGKLRESVAIMMSCKGSIKANQYINEYEIKELLQSLCDCEQPYTCPHGRPIIVKMTKHEIEKLFKRVM